MNFINYLIKTISDINTIGDITVNVYSEYDEKYKISKFVQKHNSSVIKNTKFIISNINEPNSNSKTAYFIEVSLHKRNVIRQYNYFIQYSDLVNKNQYGDLIEKKDHPLLKDINEVKKYIAGSDCIILYINSLSADILYGINFDDVSCLSICGMKTISNIQLSNDHIKYINTIKSLTQLQLASLTINSINIDTISCLSLINITGLTNITAQSIETLDISNIQGNYGHLFKNIHSINKLLFELNQAYDVLDLSHVKNLKTVKLIRSNITTLILPEIHYLTLNKCNNIFHFDVKDCDNLIIGRMQKKSIGLKALCKKIMEKRKIIKNQ